MTELTYEQVKVHLCSYGTAVHCDTFQLYREFFNIDEVRQKFHAYFWYDRGCVILEEECNEGERRKFFYRVHQCAPDAEIDAVTEDWRLKCLKNAAGYKNPICSLIQFFVSNGEITEEKERYPGFRNFSRMGYTAVKDPRVRELFDGDTDKIRSAFEPFLEDDTDFGRQEAKKLSAVEYDWIKKQDPHYGLFGIFDGDTLCGAADVTYDEDLDLAWLRDVFIQPAYRHRGYGKALVETALSAYPDKKWHYQADRENHSSIALAKSLGFTLEGAGLWVMQI